MNENERVYDYYSFLKDKIDRIEGEINPAIRHLPDFILLLSDLLNIKKITQDERNRIFIALGYLLTPVDWIPEIMVGLEGYIDDVYVICYVLAELIGSYGIGPVADLWGGQADFHDAFMQSFKSSREVLERLKISEKIHDFLGWE